MQQPSDHVARLIKPYVTYAGLGFLDASFHGVRFHPHVHEEYSIGLIVAGDLCFERDRGKRYHVGAAGIAAINPGELHTGHDGGGDGWSYRNIFLPPSALRELLQDEGVEDLELTRSVINDADLTRLATQMHSAVRSPHSSRLEGETAIALFLRRLFATYGNVFRKRELKRCHTGVALCRAYIDEHASDDIRLSDLAGITGLSQFHLLRSFARECGLTPHAYQVQIRLRSGLRLLKQGLSIDVAAKQAGFHDRSHFGKALKQSWGITPGAFKRGLALDAG
jgi:AraC-like DNA-binding protein